MTDLSGKIIALHDALTAAAVPHAFGGALALAYCTLDPRATSDVDVNLFVAPDDATRTLRHLPPGVRWTAADVATIERDGQTRLWWDATPIDVFFAYDDFHWQAARRTRPVPFEDRIIPVLECTDLAVFKAFFARRKDFADIEAMATAGTLDGDRALAVIASLLGQGSRNYTELAAVLAETGAG